MQKFKLSWMALLRNDEHAHLIEQLCGILDDRPVENPSVRNESGRKGEIAPSRPALRRIGIAQARTDGRAGGVVGKTPSDVDLARHAGESGLVVAAA